MTKAEIIQAINEGNPEEVWDDLVRTIDDILENQIFMKETETISVYLNRDGTVDYGNGKGPKELVFTASGFTLEEKEKRMLHGKTWSEVLKEYKPELWKKGMTEEKAKEICIKNKIDYELQVEAAEAMQLESTKVEVNGTKIAANWLKDKGIELAWTDTEELVARERKA